MVEKYRNQITDIITNETHRRRFWEEVLQGPIAEMVLAGKASAAEELLLRKLEDKDFSAEQIGEVYLVGAGPGDPDLLTFRALRMMQQADVVVLRSFSI